MDQFNVEYQTIKSLLTWAADATEAESVAQAQPDYHATESVTNLLTFPFIPSQTVYTFDKESDAILTGSVTAVDFVNSTIVNVMVRLVGDSSDTLFSWDQETSTVIDLYATKQEVYDYLERNLP